jgi:hypothetical protein
MGIDEVLARWVVVDLREERLCAALTRCAFNHSYEAAVASLEEEVIRDIRLPMSHLLMRLRAFRSTLPKLDDLCDYIVTHKTVGAFWVVEAPSDLVLERVNECIDPSQISCLVPGPFTHYACDRRATSAEQAVRRGAVGGQQSRRDVLAARGQDQGAEMCHDYRYLVDSHASSSRIT